MDVLVTFIHTQLNMMELHILIQNVHDTIWGSCECEKCKSVSGKNLLGKALMEVRKKLM